MLTLYHFFPQQVPFPNVTADTYLKQAVSDIIDILQSPKNNFRSLTYGNKTTNAIIYIAKLLQYDTPPKCSKTTKITPGSEETHNPTRKQRLQPNTKKYVPATEPRVPINHTSAAITHPPPELEKSVPSPLRIKAP